MKHINRQVVVPFGGDEKLLERAVGRVRRQGNRLVALTIQILQQAPAIGVKMSGRPSLLEARTILPKVFRKGRSEARNL